MEKEPLYRKVNTTARGVFHCFGADFSTTRRSVNAGEIELDAISMKKGMRRGLDYTPLFRFLLSRVGRKWDEIYSEAVARLDRNDPIFWMVALREVDAQEYFRSGEASYFSGLKVDEAGVLRVVNLQLALEVSYRSARAVRTRSTESSSHDHMTNHFARSGPRRGVPNHSLQRTASPPAELYRYASQLPSPSRHRSLMTNVLRSVLLFLSLVFVPLVSTAQSPVPERGKENFMVVVRESMGANRTEDALSPTGKFKAKLADGREIEMEVASWEFIGDTHIRFVFDGPQMMINATPDDLERLGIKSVEEALSLALVNIKRVYGEPSAAPWESGLMQVSGKSPDLNSAYFLDRAYWQSLLKSHPEGIVVSVAKRGGLLYVPLSDTGAVEKLKRGVAYLHASSGRLRVSSALYLFKEGKWSVFQAPVKQ